MLLNQCRRVLSGIMSGYLYAVRVGRNPGVYKTWSECESQVKHFPKARFKKFKTQTECLAFINEGGAHGNSGTNGNQQPQPSLVRQIHQAASASTSHHPVRESSSNQPARVGVVVKCNSQGQRSFSTTNGDSRMDGNSQAGKRSLSSGNQQQRKSKRPKIDLNTANRVAVYTDGCCTSNGRRGARAGIGVYWGPEHPKNVADRLHGRQTNQTAEIMAAVKALETAKEMNIDKIAIYTDSMFTINCITQWIHNWKRNNWRTRTGPVIHKDELIQLESLCEQVDVKWVHVPGHSNIHGNEEADKLAKEGASKPLE
ncbi:ribonuclease H1-like [Glandiceps talaboti]